MTLRQLIKHVLMVSPHPRKRPWYETIEPHNKISNITCTKYWKSGGMIIPGRMVVMSLFVSVIIIPKAPLKPSG